MASWVELQRMMTLVDEGKRGVAVFRAQWAPDADSALGPYQVTGLQAEPHKFKLKSEPILQLNLNGKLFFAAPLFSCQAGMLPVSFLVASNDELRLTVVTDPQGACPDIQVCFRYKDLTPKPPPPPTDMSARTTISGMPIDEAVHGTKPNGQRLDYVVLTDEERAKGFVRPVRESYKHLKCGAVTTMSRKIAETYACCPVGFYSGTFCCACRDHFPIGEAGEFIWDDGSGEKVGT